MKTQQNKGFAAWWGPGTWWSWELTSPVPAAFLLMAPARASNSSSNISAGTLFMAPNSEGKDEGLRLAKCWGLLPVCPRARSAGPPGEGRRFSCCS